MVKSVHRISGNSNQNPHQPGNVPAYVWGEDTNPIKGTTEDKGVYYSLRPTIILANLFAMTTLTNVTKASTESLGFQWLRLTTIYSVIVLSLMTLSSMMALIHFFYSFSSVSGTNNNNFSSVADRLGAPCFYISASVSFALLLNVTRKLPNLLKNWTTVVARLTKYSKGQQHRWTTNSTGCGMSVLLTTLITIIFMTSAITEHVLHDMHVFSTTNCTENDSFIECDLNQINDFVGGVLGPGQTTVIMATYVVNKYANFAWNFHDLVLIQISLGLAFNFNVISKHLETCNWKCLVADWKSVREDHQALCKIARSFDESLSPLVLLSYGINVFFLAKQIYMGVRLNTKTMLEIYYVVTSFVHLVGRIVAVTFSASALYDQATNIMIYLLDCPSESFNIEVQRLIDNINYGDIGFTGWKMFVVNRRLFLAIISVLFTYELLLLGVH